MNPNLIYSYILLFKSIIFLLLKILGIVVPLLVSVAYFTALERKLMGAIQRRKGPNVIGFAGLLQPFADGLKLFAKELIIPNSANTVMFIFAPILSFILSLISWSVVPFSENSVITDAELGILYILALSSLNIYGVLLSGWASNSKYAYLGAMRSAAQMISYEISIGFILLSVCVCAGSFNLSEIVLAQQEIWFVIPVFPCYVMFHISMLAETNRHPFDLPEAEAELVSGYNVEYSAMTFALFFLSEYANMILMSAFVAILFLGGWLPLIDIYPLNNIAGEFWFSIKILLEIVFFIVTRATLPRYRYDQLMALGWRGVLPISVGYVIVTSFLLIGIDGLPS